MSAFQAATSGNSGGNLAAPWNISPLIRHHGIGSKPHPDTCKAHAPCNIFSN
jgi:hypothetical protein